MEPVENREGEHANVLDTCCERANERVTGEHIRSHLAQPGSGTAGLPGIAPRKVTSKLGPQEWVQVSWHKRGRLERIAFQGRVWHLGRTWRLACGEMKKKAEGH